ncbi:Plasmodesmata callose-binding protein 5 [Vitis vinifera]|uniref:Plasmodesmata callose-binding protein 5 n=1 Tax=Vitis vinifera TaxID=29760 RepID=A0A438EGA8_VITVI|nr:Plasmodesmata callose-binding protein 5 [Vitis vinifera]
MKFSLFLVSLLLTVTLPLHSLAAQSKAQNGVVTLELWCVAKNNADNPALQTALDWACGPGGADCSPIQQGGPCYDSQDLQKTASFAFNDYYLKHGSDDSCAFDNTAALTSLNPSFGNCKFPSSLLFYGEQWKLCWVNEHNGNGTASADLSGCSRIAGRWVQALITVHLLIAVILIL